MLSNSRFPVVSPPKEKVLLENAVNMGISMISSSQNEGTKFKYTDHLKDEKYPVKNHNLSINVETDSPIVHPSPNFRYLYESNKSPRLPIPNISGASNSIAVRTCPLFSCDYSVSQSYLRFLDPGGQAVTLPNLGGMKWEEDYAVQLGEDAQTESPQDESPIPYRDIDLTITNSHFPPFTAQEAKNDVRKRIEDEHNRRLFPSSDYFTNYMENRLIRWRPSDSQYNMDETMEGVHPFQLLRSDEKKAPSVETIYQSFKNWIMQSDRNERSQNAQPTTNCQAENIEVENGLVDLEMNLGGAQPSQMPCFGRNFSSGDVKNALKAITFKPNSSKSIILPNNVLEASQRTTAAILTGRGQVISEAGILPIPSYTPKAFAFCDSELIFEKRRSGNEPYYQGNDENIASAMEEVPHLLFGLDNFFSNIGNTLTEYFNSIGECCC